MNTKENILDAWILVENLSEGSVEPGEQGMMTLDRETENWEEHFREFLQQNKEKEKLSDKAFQKSGIVLFLGIFDFDEVIDILKKKYNLEDTYEDRSKSKKFTAALFFDKDLQFLGNKFFYTMSGYIRNYGDFPKDIGEEERNLSDEIRGKFERERNKENGFHCVITWILKYETLLLRPKIIVCLGRIAAQRIIRPDYRITREHGVFLERKNTWLTAVYHPSAVLRDETKLPQMQEDFRKIREKLEEVRRFV